MFLNVSQETQPFSINIFCRHSLRLSLPRVAPKLKHFYFAVWSSRQQIQRVQCESTLNLPVVSFY